MNFTRRASPLRVVIPDDVALEGYSGHEKRGFNIKKVGRKRSDIAVFLSKKPGSKLFLAEFLVGLARNIVHESAIPFFGTKNSGSGFPRGVVLGVVHDLSCDLGGLILHYTKYLGM